MTDKELRRLRRDDLLQILINQQRQIDELNASLEQAQAALAKRDITIQESGSVAEAALKLNGVFEAAQAAADQYLEQMRAEADGLRAEAGREADRARREADDVLRSARSEADRILREARSEGERLKAEAVKRVDEARQGAVEAPAQASETPPPEEGKQRRGLLWRNRKA